MLNVLLVVEIRSSTLLIVTCCNNSTSLSLTRITFPHSTFLAVLLTFESEFARYSSEHILAILVVLSREYGLFQVLIPLKVVSSLTYRHLCISSQQFGSYSPLPRVTRYSSSNLLGTVADWTFHSVAAGRYFLSLLVVG